MFRKDYAKQLMSIPFKEEPKLTCVVCGKIANDRHNDNETPLCRTHTFDRGTIYILNMQNWTWRREQR